MEGLTDTMEIIQRQTSLNTAKMLDIFKRELSSMMGNRSDMSGNNNNFYIIMAVIILFGFISFIYLVHKKENNNQSQNDFQKFYINSLENKLKSLTNNQLFNQKSNIQITDVTGNNDGGNMIANYPFQNGRLI